MTSPISSVRGLVPATACDFTPPRALEPLAAEFADFIQRDGYSRVIAQHDPLYMVLGNVEPGATIEFINVSAKPNAHFDGDQKALPINQEPGVSLPNGKYSFAFTNETADGLGIRPGDTLDLRQVDAAGNASPTVRVKLPQHQEQTAIVIDGGDHFQNQVAGLQAGNQYVLSRYADGREPVVVLENLEFTNHDDDGKLQLVGSRAVEPEATIQIQNQRTLEWFKGTVDEAMQFAVPFEAQCGDPIHVQVTDRHGMSTDLGLVNVAVEGGCGAEPAPSKGKSGK